MTRSPLPAAAVSALAFFCGLAALAETYLLDETLLMPRLVAPIEELTTPAARSAWVASFGQCNGFHLLDGPPGRLARMLSTRSVALHVKYYGTIFEQDVFDFEGEPLPSAIPPFDSPVPEAREMLLQYGAVILRALTSLDLDEPFDAPYEIVIWGRDEQDRPKVLKILLNAAAGGQAIFPRDFYREVDALPLEGPETVFEIRYVLRRRYDLSAYGFGDESLTFDLPFRWVVGISVRPALIGGSPLLHPPPELTVVNEILDPAQPLCPCDSASWFLHDDLPPAPGDEGELCFDVDALTSLDEYILPMAGTGAIRIILPMILNLLGFDHQLPPFDPFYHAFPEVLDEYFDHRPHSMFRGYMAARCLMNRGFRMLDTVNPETGPSIRDVHPLTHGINYARTYDGAPIEMGFQLRRAWAPGLQGDDLLHAAGAFRLLDLGLVPVISGDYRLLVRTIRFYIARPSGRLQQVTAPQLLQLISTQWNKAPAYTAPHHILRDHPRLDLGQLGPFTFQVHAKVRMPGRLFAPYRSLRYVVSAYPGLYSTNYYGDDPLHQ